MKKHTTAFFAAAALVALAACGGSSDGGPTYVTAADSATIDMFARSADDLSKNTLLAVFDDQDVGPPDPFFFSATAGARDPGQMALGYIAHVRQLTEFKNGSSPLAAAGIGSRLEGITLSAAVCQPTVTGADDLGDPIDSDNDGIPNDYRVDFGSACTETDATYSNTISGFFRIRDTGTGFASYAFTTGNLNVKSTEIATGDFLSFGVNGAESASFGASLAEHHFAVTASVAARNAGQTTSILIITTEDATYDPDAGSSFTLFGALPAGAFDYSADYRVVGENSGGEVAGNFRFQISTPTPLHYLPGCTAVFDSGVFRGLLNGDSNIGFTLTWTTCAEPVLDVFGNTP